MTRNPAGVLGWIAATGVLSGEAGWKDIAWEAPSMKTLMFWAVCASAENVFVVDELLEPLM